MTKERDLNERIAALQDILARLTYLKNAPIGRKTMARVPQARERIQDACTACCQAITELQQHKDQK